MKFFTAGLLPLILFLHAVPILAQDREAVVLLHGIMNKPFVMDRLAHRLREDGYEVYNWGYPSTDGVIQDHAKRLNAFLASLSAPRIHFVGFSQGAIIIRYTLTHYPQSRAGRFVMIAPPNHGCELAEDFYRYAWFRGLYGDKSIKQLFAKQNDFLKSCGIPREEFGIIAGGKSDSSGFSDRIPGDDDGTISVQSAHLEGEKDFVVLPHMHTPLVFSGQTADLVSRFLKTGSFSDAKPVDEAATGILRLHPHDRILVLAPHPDDEVIGTGGVLQQAVAMKLPVRVVFLTNGDNYEWAFMAYKKRPVLVPAEVRRMGLLRHEEAVAAEKILGIPEEDVQFLGYPDWGTEAIWMAHWGAERAPLRSMLTHVTDVPYENAYRPGALYKGEEILSDLKDIVQDFKPTKIFVGHPADAHRDHRSSFLFMQVALWELSPKPMPEVYPFLIHFPRWPSPLGFRPDEALASPRDFDRLPWKTFPLSSEERDRKELALKAHRTQVLKDRHYLESFVKANELFDPWEPIRISRHGNRKHQLFTKGFPAPHEKEEELDDAADLAWKYVHLEGDDLVVAMEYSRPHWYSGLRARFYLFGFRQDTPFEKMPKLSVRIRGNQVRVFDQGLADSDVGVHMNLTDHVMVVRIPLKSLGDPQKIIGTAWSRAAHDPFDWRAWRVMELEGPNE